MNILMIGKNSIKHQYLKNFYRHLNMEDITDANYMHAKKAFKYFEIKDIGKYQELYVQSDILSLLMYLSWNI